MNEAGPERMTQIQREQIAAYERRGPIMGRLTQLATAVALIAAVVISTLVFDTVASFYPGTGAVRSTPAEQSAEAAVRDCQRVGPVSGEGLGYWWRCAVTVRTRDGREVKTVVGHSVVTPADRGSRSISVKCATGRGIPIAGTAVPFHAFGLSLYRCWAW
ncbi:hypothetical protein Jiend_33420 [Micromonospora endophytica]|nr:DUF6346 domain-containing protein [Micromonospora endophytica]BCJ59920.1 hypothetical protein Jiend_33420 [Micromonospora endophytica]